MRENKFRVWIPEKKVFADEAELYSDGSFGYTIGNVSSTGNKSILEFYSGLKDKNGKDICEGDVVACIKNKFGKGEHEYWVIEWGSFGDAAYYAVNQINSCRILKGSLGNGTFFSISNDETVCEVIGNIHQNPEMLR